MTTDNKAYLDDIMDAETARLHITGGLWRAIDLPGHPCAALVVWRMEDGWDRNSPELNARKLVAGFNVCETGLGSYDQSVSAAYEVEQEAAERPIPQMTPLQAAIEALSIAESYIKGQLQGTKKYEAAMIQLNPVRAAIIAAGGNA